MFGEVFECLVQEAPVAVMVRGILERILGEEALNQLYDRAADRQYTRELVFSIVFELMNLVVCKVYPSIHAAYQRKQQAIGTSITSVYDKLSGIDTLHKLANKVNLAHLKKHKRGPKTSTSKRIRDRNQPHVSTAKLLKGE
jgi:hypothetical protein